MGFMAAAIPIIASVLGSMGKEEQQAPAAAVPPKPTLGQTFAQNEANFSQNNDQNQQLAQLLGQNRGM